MSDIAEERDHFKAEFLRHFHLAADYETALVAIARAEGWRDDHSDLEKAILNEIASPAVQIALAALERKAAHDPCNDRRARVLGKGARHER